MTAPDPLVCANSRAAAGETTCGEPLRTHCMSCSGCPSACACPPLPPVGTQVLPKPGTQSENKPVPPIQHTVVSTWDHRRNGDPLDYVITVQPSAIVQCAVTDRRPVDTSWGAYLGLDDIELLDQPPITFTAKEPTS